MQVACTSKFVGNVWWTSWRVPLACSLFTSINTRRRLCSCWQQQQQTRLLSTTTQCFIRNEVSGYRANGLARPQGLHQRKNQLNSDTVAPADETITSYGSVKDYPLLIYFDGSLQENQPALDHDQVLAITDTYSLRLLVSTAVAEAFKQDCAEIVKGVKEKCEAKIEVSDTIVPEGVVSITCPVATIEQCLCSLMPLITQQESDPTAKLRLLVHRALSAPDRPAVELYRHRLDCPQSAERVIHVVASKDCLANVVKMILDFVAENFPPLNKTQNAMLYDPSCLAKLPPRTASLYGGYEGQQDSDKRIVVKLTMPEWMSKSVDEENNHEITLNGTVHAVESVIYWIRKLLHKTAQGRLYLGTTRTQNLRRRNKDWWAENEYKINKLNDPLKNKDALLLESFAPMAQSSILLMLVNLMMTNLPNLHPLLPQLFPSRPSASKIVLIKKNPAPRPRTKAITPAKIVAASKLPNEKMLESECLNPLDKPIKKVGKRSPDEHLTKLATACLTDPQVLKKIALKQDCVGKVFLYSKTVSNDQPVIQIKVSKEATTLLRLENNEILRKIRKFSKLKLKIESDTSGSSLLTFRGPDKSVKNSIQRLLKNLKLSKFERRILELQKQKQPKEQENKKDKEGFSDAQHNDHHQQAVRLEDVHLDTTKLQMMQKLAGAKLLRLGTVPSTSAILCQCSCRLLSRTSPLHRKCSLSRLKALQAALARVNKKLASKKMCTVQFDASPPTQPSLLATIIEKLKVLLTWPSSPEKQLAIPSLQSLRDFPCPCSMKAKMARFNRTETPLKKPF
uniref:Uncharacterized protein n=1 Tax=Ditylenchus dipsaci TaxID=166011 RepID=A0A915D3I4_9BILA